MYYCFMSAELLCRRVGDDVRLSGRRNNVASLRHNKKKRGVLIGTRHAVQGLRIAPITITRTKKPTLNMQTLTSQRDPETSSE